MADTIKGFTSRVKSLTNGRIVEPVTRDSLSCGQEALDVRSSGATILLGTYSVLAQTENTVTATTTPTGRRGDIVRFAGTEDVYTILSISGNVITLTAPRVAVFPGQFTIERWTYSKLSPGGFSATAVPHGPNWRTESTLNFSSYFVTSRAILAGSSTTVINVSSDPTGAIRVGDLARITSGVVGTGSLSESFVTSLTTTTVTVDSSRPFSNAPGAGQTISFYREVANLCGSDGSMAISGGVIINGGQIAVRGDVPVSSVEYSMTAAAIAGGGGSFQPVGVSAFGAIIYRIEVFNFTPVPLAFSYDGGNFCAGVAAEASKTINMAECGFYFDPNNDFYVRYVAAVPLTGECLIGFWYY